MSSSSRNKKYFWKAALLYYYGKLIGLFPLSLNKVKGKFRTSYLGNLYAILLCISYSVIFYQFFIIRLKNTSPIESIISAVWDRITHFYDFSVIIVSWLTFGLRQKKLKSIIDDIEKTNKIAQKLGIENDMREIVTSIGIQALFINILCYGHSIFNLIILSMIDIPLFHQTFWILNVLVRVVIHNMLFLFISALQIVEKRFRRLNHRLSYLKIHNPIVR